MDLSITFESSVPRQTVVLHAWEPLGQTWDIRATEDKGRFVFRLQGNVADQRTVSFKFLFPDQQRWEPDDYVRRIPTRRVAKFWAFDLSARVMIHDPYDAPPPSEVTFFLQTRAEFVGGSLYVWEPGTANSLRVEQQQRLAHTESSVFNLTIEPWMREGFYFKFVTREQRFEGERSNRVWRPGDGPKVYLKAGQMNLRRNPLALSRITVFLLYPASLSQPPELVLRDSIEPYTEVLRAADQPIVFKQDDRFRLATYTTSVFPESGYTLMVADRTAEPRLFNRPVRVAHDDSDAQRRFTALLGYDGWLKDIPDIGPVRFVFHPAAHTNPIKTLAFRLAVGQAPSFAELSAGRASDGSWTAETAAFVGIPLAALPIASPPVDQRAEGPVSAWRVFQLADASGTELHTVDGRLGFVRSLAPIPTAKRTGGLR